MPILTHTLISGHTVTGNVRHIVMLAARFSIWARQYGLDDRTSMACWLANMPQDHKTYFKSTEEVLLIAQRGFEVIRKIDVPDLSDPQ